jgi:membrane glycosyltransferase
MSSLHVIVSNPLDAAAPSSDSDPTATLSSTPAPVPVAMPAQDLRPATASTLLRALARVWRRHPGTPARPRHAPQSTADLRRREHRLLWVRRWGLLMAVTLSTTIAGLRMTEVLQLDGLSAWEGVFLVTFTVLFGWINASFWIACLGAWALRRGVRVMPRAGVRPPTDREETLPEHRAPATTRPAPARARTAIVMPVYNEDAARVFAGLRSMMESLQHAAAARGFDVFVLSDSTSIAAQAAERSQWRQLRQALAGCGTGLYYRHRAQNIGRKSGNIADFCENWGSRYEYMVVLDADSLMTGATLARMVELMDQHPRAGLIQVPPALVGRESLFARMQQFASSLYGPVHAMGLALLQGPDGNYWGHNAIIRVQPFIEHCGLPALPGRGPLSGEIMSHDFVEAALLRRAGWQVWMAPELDGSYEEPPPTLGDHLQRDRRWCHGNLQHLRLIPARGLRLPSRMHMALGVMTYLSSPLWALMLVASAIVARQQQLQSRITYLGRHPELVFPADHGWALVALVAATVALLFGPKLLALGVAARRAGGLQAFGGRWRATASFALECVYSTLIAPVVMISHTRFVLDVLFGARATWRAQQRKERQVPWVQCVRAYAAHTLIGAVSAAVLYAFIPELFWWFSPLTGGLVLSIPLALLSADPRVGRWAQRHALFLTPVQTQGLPVLERVKDLLAASEDPIVPQGPPRQAAVG